MNLIYALPETAAFRKSDLLNKFSSVFFKNYQPNHFANHGEIESYQDALPYFQQLAIKYHEQWIGLRKTASLPVSLEEDLKIKAVLDKLVMDAAKSCAKQILSNPLKSMIGIEENTNLASEVENEIANQSENNNEEELQLEQEQSRESKAIIVNNARLFTLPEKNSLFSFVRSKLFSAHNANGTYLLGAQHPFNLDSNIFISDRQAKTIKGQLNYYDNVKPIKVMIMVADIKNPEALKCYIVTKKEANIYAKMSSDALAAKFPNQNIWLISPSEMLLAGTPPVVLPKNYSRVLEQVRFINGDVKYLSKQKEGFGWLAENTEAKLAFLKQKVLPRFPEKAKSYGLLKARLTTLTNKECNAGNNVEKNTDVKKRNINFNTTNNRYKKKRTVCFGFSDCFSNNLFNRGKKRRTEVFSELVESVNTDLRIDIVDQQPSKRMRQ